MLSEANHLLAIASNSCRESKLCVFLLNELSVSHLLKSLKLSADQIIYYENLLNLLNLLNLQNLLNDKRCQQYIECYNENGNLSIVRGDTVLAVLVVFRDC